jgi:transmembrane sensor
MTDHDEAIAPADGRWLEALEWYRRLQESRETELTPDLIHSWRKWLADDQNRQVFDQLSHLVEDGPLLRRCTLISRGDGSNQPSDSSAPVPAGAQSKEATGVQRAALRTIAVSRGATVALIAAAAAAAILGIFLPSIERQFFSPLNEQGAPAQLYETGLGEVRSVPLDDGSTVTLGARSSIVVQLSAERRSVRLGRGEAWFRVAHDSNRPFVVHAGARSITAVGTAFVVERDSDRVLVTVTEGTVQVSRHSTDGSSFVLAAILARVHPATARVARGEQMSYEDSGSASQIEHVDAEAATSWSQGRLEFEHAPLRRVVAVVNRYSHRAISLDPAIGDQVFTGIVLQGEIDNWICGLEDIFPVNIVEQGEQTLVRPRLPGIVRPASRCSPDE